MHETFPPSNGSAAGRTAPPLFEVDEDRARRTWVDAVAAHPELQGRGTRDMRRVALQMALTVEYDPQRAQYGQCRPTDAELVAWCGLSLHAVRRALRGLKARGILTVGVPRP